eukprot:g11597.t1
MCLPLVDVWLVSDEIAERQVAAQATLTQVAEFLPECHRPQETTEERQERLAAESAEIAEAERRFAQGGVDTLGPTNKSKPKSKSKAKKGSNAQASVVAAATAEAPGSTAISRNGELCKTEAQGEELGSARAGRLLSSFEQWAQGRPGENVDDRSAGPQAGAGRWSMHGIGQRYAGAAAASTSASPGNVTSTSPIPLQTTNAARGPAAAIVPPPIC